MIPQVLITITQTMGDDDVVLDLKWDETKDIIFMERTEVNQIYKLSGPKTLFLLAEPTRHKEKDLFVILRDIIVGILLENGSDGAYRSVISLRHGTLDDQMAFDMLKSMEELSVKFKEPSFNDLSDQYERKKDALYDTVLQTYTFAGQYYAEYVKNEPVMARSVERMVRLFVTMNRLPVMDRNQ